MVTGKETFGAGAFFNCTANVVVPTGKLPHPVAAWTLSATGDEEAVPPVKGVTVSHEGNTATLLSTVKGVPPGAGDDTLTITAFPRV
jgi:hypothetical protein